MQGSDDGDIRSKIAILSDNDLGIVLASEIEIKEGVLPDFGVDPIMEGDGSIKRHTFVQFAQ